MNEQPKYQISLVFTRLINGTSVNENHTLRGDNKIEIYQDRKEIIDKIAPSAVSFPDDQGEIAHTATQHHDPICEVHGTPMVSRKGKFGDFWSCPTKLATGAWCKGKPIYTY